MNTKKPVAESQPKRQKLISLKKKKKETLDPLASKIQQRPVEIQKFYTRMKSCKAGLTAEAGDGVFGPGLAYIGITHDDLILLMTQGYLDSNIIAAFML